MSVNHIGGGLTIGNQDAYIKLKAWPRIGVLVNQLRCALVVLPHTMRLRILTFYSRLLDIQLKRSVDSGMILDIGQDNPVVEAVLALLQNDGLSS